MVAVTPTVLTVPQLALWWLSRRQVPLEAPENVGAVIILVNLPVPLTPSLYEREDCPTPTPVELKHIQIEAFE